MDGEVELSLRGQDGYRLARAAIEGIEAHKVWPTPLNFELWVHYVINPEGPLDLAIERLLNDGKPITEAVAEGLAAEYLRKARLNKEIRDVGDKLNEQLDSISGAIKVAQKSTDTYGKALADASEALSALDPVDSETMVRMVKGLAGATKKVQRENASMEQRLSASTNETSRLREHLEQLRREAMTDALTGLANRKALDDGLARQCAKADASAASLTLAIIDIDHFKRFNDTWGHQTGDEVLCYVASVLRRVGPGVAFAARYGGEEFAVIFPSNSLTFVMEELESARLEIGSQRLKRRSTQEELAPVTISMGVAERLKGESTSDLIERADAALYQSKINGRNRLTIAPRKAHPGKVTPDLSIPG